MTTNEVAEWHPKQEKYIRWGVNAALVGGAVVGGSILIKTFVPTVTDALNLLQRLLASTTSMLLTAAGTAATVWLIYETFSPKGKINGLFAQAYSSFIRNATLELLNVDPMSPLKDSLEAVTAKQRDYDEAFAQFDGQISIFQQREDDFRQRAAQSEKRAKAAQKIGNEAAMRQEAYASNSALGTANNMAAMRARLVPVRVIIVKLQEASADLISQLNIDIESTQAQWEMAQQMQQMDKKARGILSNNGKTALAQEAQMIVQNKYAASIGRLENLSTIAMPMLNSIDLDKASGMEDLLEKWAAEENGAPLKITQVNTPTLALKTAEGSFKSLI